jgi:hypothetical protein
MAGVSEYIVNPRRAPRAPSRCAIQVRTPQSAWSAETEDISPLGCQLVAPGAVPRGLELTLVFANPKVSGSVKVEGKVAWGSSRPPWRVGVAFGEQGRSAIDRWFAQLVAAYPGLSGFRRVPDRLPVDAMLFLAPPPTFLLDFSADEIEVLRHVAGGTTVAALRERLAAAWSPMQRAIFSLLARGVVTVSRGASAHPSAWKKVMAELDAEFVVEPPRAVRPLPFTEKSASSPTPPPLLSVPVAPAMPAPPVAPVAAVQAAPPPAATPTAGELPTAGTGWRGGSRTRSREAQESFDLGCRELAAGRGSSALAHLRRALQLSPGDAEIAAEIGRAMSAG